MLRVQHFNYYNFYVPTHHPLQVVLRPGNQTVKLGAVDVYYVNYFSLDLSHSIFVEAPQIGIPFMTTRQSSHKIALLNPIVYTERMCQANTQRSENIQENHIQDP